MDILMLISWILPVSKRPKLTNLPLTNQHFSPGSWRSGLGFNALIHAHRPDLINFSQLVPTKHIENLNNAFDTAENGLGIPRLLDAEGNCFVAFVNS